MTQKTKAFTAARNAGIKLLNAAYDIAEIGYPATAKQIFGLAGEKYELAAENAPNSEKRVFLLSAALVAYEKAEQPEAASQVRLLLKKE